MRFTVVWKLMHIVRKGQTEPNAVKKPLNGIFSMEGLFSDAGIYLKSSNQLLTWTSKQTTKSELSTLNWWFSTFILLNLKLWSQVTSRYGRHTLNDIRTIWSILLILHNTHSQSLENPLAHELIEIEFYWAKICWSIIIRQVHQIHCSFLNTSNAYRNNKMNL